MRAWRSVGGGIFSQYRAVPSELLGDNQPPAPSPDLGRNIIKTFSFKGLGLLLALPDFKIFLRPWVVGLAWRDRRSCYGVGSGSYHKSWQNSFFSWLLYPVNVDSPMYFVYIVSPIEGQWIIGKYDLTLISILWRMHNNLFALTSLPK